MKWEVEVLHHFAEEKRIVLDQMAPFIGSVAPVLNYTRLYKTSPGEYLEPGLFKLDPWGFIVYNFLL